MNFGSHLFFHFLLENKSVALLTLVTALLRETPSCKKKKKNIKRVALKGDEMQLAEKLL